MSLDAPSRDCPVPGANSEGAAENLNELGVPRSNGGHEPDARSTDANERTFLAWNRTARLHGHRGRCQAAVAFEAVGQAVGAVGLQRRERVPERIVEGYSPTASAAELASAAVPASRFG